MDWRHIQLSAELNTAPNQHIDTDTKEAVMARMTGKKALCPDCGKVLDTVIIERFQTKTYDINYENKQIIPKMESWDENDSAYHCPHCDTLNVNEELKGMYRLLDDPCEIFILGIDDVIDMVKAMGLSPEILTIDVIRKIRKGVNNGLVEWSEVMKTAIEEAIKD